MWENASHASHAGRYFSSRPSAPCSSTLYDMVAEKIGNANKVKTSMGEVMIRVAAGDEATSAATIRVKRGAILDHRNAA